MCNAFFSGIFDTSILPAVSEPLKTWDGIPSFVEVPEESLYFHAFHNVQNERTVCDNFPV